MTFSYVLPIATDIHRVRFYLRDTDASAPLFQDEELAELLALEADPIAAAVLAAEIAAARYRNLGSLSVGDVRIDGGEVATAYTQLAEDLRIRLTSGAPVPYAGGVDAADVVAHRKDTTLAAPSFTRVTGNTMTESERWPC